MLAASWSAAWPFKMFGIALWQGKPWAAEMQEEWGNDVCGRANHRMTDGEYETYFKKFIVFRILLGDIAEEFPSKKEVCMHMVLICSVLRQFSQTSCGEKWLFWSGQLFGFGFCLGWGFFFVFFPLALCLCPVRLFGYHWLPVQLWTYFWSTDGRNLCQNWKYLLSYQNFSF